MGLVYSQKGPQKALCANTVRKQQWETGNKALDRYWTCWYLDLGLQLPELWKINACCFKPLVYVILVLQSKLPKWVEDTLNISKTFPERRSMLLSAQPNGWKWARTNAGHCETLQYENKKSQQLPVCVRRRGEHFLDRNKSRITLDFSTTVKIRRQSMMPLGSKGKWFPSPDSRSSQTTNWMSFQMHKVSGLPPMNVL